LSFIDFITYGLRYILLHILPDRFSVRARYLDPPQRVVISLSTIPNRINKLLPTLRSLTDQSMKSTQINLVVPRFSTRENKAYEIPAKIKQFPGLNIVESEKDWGPITKLIPTLQSEAGQPDSIIIAVDDDNIYPPTFIETMVKGSLQHPHAALGLCGCNLSPARRWDYHGGIKGNRIAQDRAVDFVLGCGGILVKPAFFNTALLDYAPAPSAAFFVDDIWINGHLARNQIPRYVVAQASRVPVFLSTLTTLFSLSLDRTENRRPNNNNQVIAHFESDW
jgi:hypothetical protein